jgi:hypothetical protein
MEGITMNSLIRKTLREIGYNDCDPTENELINAFLDFVDSGAFRNLTYDEAKELIAEGEITLEQMCRNLMRVG